MINCYSKYCIREEALEVIKLQLIWCIDNDFCWETEEVFAVA